MEQLTIYSTKDIFGNTIYDTDYQIVAAAANEAMAAGVDTGIQTVNFVNLTPHDVHIWAESLKCFELIPASGQLARCATKTVVVGTIGPFTNTATEFGAVEGLPEPKDDTYYIVSSLVASRVPERHDVLIPNQLVRDEKGCVYGCESLGSI